MVTKMTAADVGSARTILQQYAAQCPGLYDGVELTTFHIGTETESMTFMGDHGVILGHVTETNHARISHLAVPTLSGEGSVQYVQRFLILLGTFAKAASSRGCLLVEGVPTSQCGSVPTVILNNAGVSSPVVTIKETIAPDPAEQRKYYYLAWPPQQILTRIQQLGIVIP